MSLSILLLDHQIFLFPSLTSIITKLGHEDDKTPDNHDDGVVQSGSDFFFDLVLVWFSSYAE